MATSYAVETSKSFSFLDDYLEDDEEVIVEKIKEKVDAHKVEKSKTKGKDKSKKESSKGGVVSAPVAQTKESSNAENLTKPAQQQKGQPKVVPAAHKVTAPVTKKTDDTGSFSVPNKSAFSSERGNRGGARGGGGFHRGAGSGGGGGRGGKDGGSSNTGVGNSGSRVFDRHSGSDVTGVKPMMKRDGHGAHNWGCEEDDIKEATQKMEHDGTFTEQDTSPDVVADTDNAGEEGTSGPGGVTASPENILTVEEYLKQNKGREEKILHGNKSKNTGAVSRMPNEGEDPFKGMQAYRKIKDDEEDESEEEEDEEDDEMSLGKKQVLNFSVMRNNRSGGGPRGGAPRRAGGRPYTRGAGGFSGARGSGMARGSGVPPPVVLQLDDDTAFPKLG